MRWRVACLTGELDVGVAAGAVGSVDDGGGLEKPDPVRCREFGGVSCREECGGVEVVRCEDREPARVMAVDPFFKSVGCGVQVAETREGLAVQVAVHHWIDVVSLEGLEEFALAGEVEGGIPEFFPFADGGRGDSHAEGDLPRGFAGAVHGTGMEFNIA